jgi:hypothetical protein
MRCDTGSRAPAAGTSAARIAYPSIAVLSAGGTRSALRTGAASTRPLASSVSTVSVSVIGVAPAIRASRAWAVVSIGGRAAV